MNDWLKQHAWQIVIALAGAFSTFTLMGYRIDTLEKQVEENKASITLLNTQQIQVQVQLAQISTDIQYIKASLDRVLGTR